MKKTIYLILISLFIGLPLVVAAITIRPGKIPTADDLGFDQDSPVKTYQGLLGVVARVVKFIYIMFFIVAIVFIIFAAFNYLTGANAPDKLASAHKQLVYAAIAIAVALMAIGIQFIVSSFLADSGNAASTNNQQYQDSLEQIPGDFR